MRNEPPLISRQFLLFLMAGGIAAVVNFGARIVLSFKVDYVPAITFAYILGMITAFTLNRLFVFEASSGALHRQVGWFIAVNLAAILQTVALSLLFAKVIFPALGITQSAETLAHAIGVAVPVVTSYLGHKYFSFAPGRKS